MEIDLILQSLLTLSVVFAIIGLSISLMRFISKATEALDEIKTTNNKVNVLADKITNDYEYVSSSLRGVSDTIDQINQEIVDPVRNLSRMVRTAQLFGRNLTNRFRNNNDLNDSYLPEEY